MDDLHAFVDRMEIEALRAEYTDALMEHDFDRLASLFTDDGAVRMPHVPAEAVGRDEIRAGVERLQGLWEFFVQTTHPGWTRLDGDAAVGRAYLEELMRGPSGSHRNYGTYHDRYRRTSDGWRFSERVYEVRYQDTTPLTGSTPSRNRSDAPEVPR